MGKTTRRHDPPTTYATKGRAKTRADKPKLIEDPDQEEKVLTQQLRASGLYAANILGDGNCLFRALSDQLFGSPNHHLRLRQEVCEYLSDHSDRYRLFIDEDDYKGGWNGYVREMKQPGTYGTNIELSAFVQLYQRSIKIFQPGLVYVMQPEPSTSTSPKRPSIADPAPSRLSAREKRAKAREEKAAASSTASKKGKAKALLEPPPATVEPEGAEQKDEESGPLCIVYHSWEHYSSLRNLKGPHTGPPRLRIARPNSPSLVEHPSNAASPSGSRSQSPPLSPSTEDVDREAEPKAEFEREPEDAVEAGDREDLHMSSPPPSPRSLRTRTAGEDRDQEKPRRRSVRLSSTRRDEGAATADPGTATGQGSNKRGRSSPLVNLHDFERDDDRDRDDDAVSAVGPADTNLSHRGAYRGNSPALTNSSSATSSVATSSAGGIASSTRGARSRRESRNGSTTSLSSQGRNPELAGKRDTAALGSDDRNDESGVDSDEDVVVLLRPPPRTSTTSTATTTSTARPRKRASPRLATTATNSSSSSSCSSPCATPSSFVSSSPPRARSPSLLASPSKTSDASEKKEDVPTPSAAAPGGRKRREGVVTSREKKELNRARRMERRRATPNSKQAEAPPTISIVRSSEGPGDGEGRTLRNGKKVGRSDARGTRSKTTRTDEDPTVGVGLGGRVRELYI
ncbi:hypothetical protein JCM3766R1_002546 [Sporobolomyces carnicolor]